MRQHPDEMVAVAAGDAGVADVAALRRPRRSTGAKPSLWPLPWSSISTRWVVPTRLSSQAVRRAAAASRSRAARALTISRSTCGIRAAGVPGRGEKGKTWAAITSQSSSRRRLFRAIASVSVGKPAIRSAPMVASGRAALIRSTSPHRVGAASGGASCA